MYIYMTIYIYVYVYIFRQQVANITQKNPWISSNSGSLPTTPVTRVFLIFEMQRCPEVTLKVVYLIDFDRCHVVIQAGPKDLSPWWFEKTPQKNGCKCATFQLPIGDLEVQSSRFGWWVSLQDIHMEWGAMMGGGWIWLLWLHDLITIFFDFTQIPSLETHVISYI